MDEYNDRLEEQATTLFRTQLPDLCKRFHDILDQDDYLTQAIPAVRTIIQKSCQSLVEHKRQKESIRLIEKEKRDFNHSDDEEFHTPMASESEMETGKEPPRKRVKVFAKKKRVSRKGVETRIKGKEDDAVLECNPHISRMMNMLKPELRAVIECCNTLKAWVQLQVPEMQDGNNFGVEVQNDMLNEVRGVETKAHAFLQALTVYHLTRAEIASKFAKKPGVKDYVRALEELDIKEFVSLRLIVREVRNLCVGLLDTFTKNMDNITTPRSHSENILVC